MLLPARWLIFGGEALHAEVVEKIFDSGATCGIVNHYGPTETTIGKLLHVIDPGRAYPNTIPIGRPFSNTRVYVLSANGQLCPLGVPGELFIAGDGVAAGYINNASLTNEKFIPDHFSNIPGATMYRTGDIVKYLPDGNILFIGRADNQVKIRGYRVEPGEIESVLQQAPGIVNGVVSVHEDSHANKRLVAYVTGEGIDKESVMLYLRSKLPEYMVPPVLMQVPAIPLTPNGKIDRRKLPAPDITVTSSSYHAPRNAVESQLAEIWQELLGVERVGIHDNFFELGGNSLLVMRMDAYIKRLLQVSIPMQVLFQLSSINEMSKYLEVETQAGKQEDAGFEIVTI
jgi:acyl-coenzyme A synthetase/AMP-(fatty) acid ligase/acyl carrier protein